MLVYTDDFGVFMCSLSLSCIFRMVFPMYVSQHFLYVILKTIPLRLHILPSERGQSDLLHASESRRGLSICFSVAMV